MTIDSLRKVRIFVRNRLAFVKSAEDFDIVLEVGYHQERGIPLTQKQIALSGIASVATVKRRLRRLVAMKVVTKTQHDSDGRLVLLRLSSAALRDLRKLSQRIKKMDW